LHIEDFTIATMRRRLDEVGDLWGETLRQRNTSKAVDRVLAEE